MQEFVTTREAGQQNGRIHARLYWPDILAEQTVRDWALYEIRSIYEFQSRPVPPEAECHAYADGYWQGYQEGLADIRDGEGIEETSNGTAE